MIRQDTTGFALRWFGLLAAILCMIVMAPPPAHGQSGFKKLIEAMFRPKDAAKSNLTGSIKVPAKISKAERAALAKITAGDATEFALAGIGSKDGRVKDVGLKVANGFLVYVVDVALIGGKEIEVIVDAGNGKVLYPVPDPLMLTRTGDRFTAVHQGDALTVTLSGTISDGQTKIGEITIQDGELTRKFNDVARVPESLRATVQGVIESVEKKNRVP